LQFRLPEIARNCHYMQKASASWGRDLTYPFCYTTFQIMSTSVIA